MQRRAALKNLAMTMGGLLSLPVWAFAWTPASLGRKAILPLEKESLLAEIMETIIPQTDTPGAKSLQVHSFVMRMIDDCYEQPVQEQFKKGISETQRVANGLYGQSFMACNVSQRQGVLNTMSKASDPAAGQFIEMIKQLTISGYLNSEYVMVHMLKYNMAPGFYHGCVPVKA